MNPLKSIWDGITHDPVREKKLRQQQSPQHPEPAAEPLPLRTAPVAAPPRQHAPEIPGYARQNTVRPAQPAPGSMQLIIHREQRMGGVMGNKVVFQLAVKARITEAEKAAIAKYKLGATLLYTKMEIVDPGRGLLGFASRLAFKAMNIQVTVDDLAVGKKIDCTDILEMLAVEEQIKEAAVTFKQVLNAATQFGGYEVIEL